MFYWINMNHISRGAESAVILKKFPQRRCFSPTNFPEMPIEIKNFPPTALAQTGTFCNPEINYILSRADLETPSNIECSARVNLFEKQL
jgi:hypothetical protein